jgi:hypothetical protein
MYYPELCLTHLLNELTSVRSLTYRSSNESRHTPLKAIAIMSYAIAAILHVTVEIPFANVTKLLVPAKRGAVRDEGLRWKDWGFRR